MSTASAASGSINATPRSSPSSAAADGQRCGGRPEALEGGGIGRLQIRPDRSGSGEDSAAGAGGRWRESKTTVLQTYLGEVHTVDPDPDAPSCFLDLAP